MKNCDCGHPSLVLEGCYGTKELTELREKHGENCLNCGGFHRHFESLPKLTLTRAQKAADVVTEFCGSWTFIISFSLITMTWMAAQHAAGEFDPYPFILLNLFLTVVSTFQSPLIMMSQNRQMERDREAIRGLHAKLDDMAEQLKAIQESK